MNKKKIEFTNKKAIFDYQIVENYEAGIVLTGAEIKSIRSGRISLVGSYVKIINGEAFWLGGNFTDLENKDRTKKLLLHLEEIKRLQGKAQEAGFTIVPIKLYLKRGRAKLLIGLARGKKQHDKRETIKKRDQQREAGRAIKY